VITQRDLSDPRGLGTPLSLVAGQVCEWVTPDDLLVVGVRNSLAGLQLGLNGRLWHTDGSVAELNQVLIPGSARALQFFSLPLDFGFLTSLAVTALVGTPHRGQTLASLQLARPPAASFASKMFMAQDYITAQNGVAWPGGKIAAGVDGQGIRSVFSVGSPAAGADWTQTVPAGARWLLHGIRAQLLSSATAGNRTPALQIDDGTNAGVNISPGVVQAASLTNTWSWTAGYPTIGTLVGTQNQITMPFPVPLLAGWRIRVITANLSGTDQWSAIFLDVEEWLED
jgi:hypothetical protein